MCNYASPTPVRNPYVVDQGDPTTPKIIALVGDETAMVAVELRLRGTAIFSVGESKRHPNDTPDPDIGLALAYARALGGLAAECNAVAGEWIEEADRA